MARFSTRSEVTVITTIVSVVLAYPLAYILAYQVPRQWQRVALLVAIVPFWTSYVVRSYSWLLVLAKGGVVNGALMSLGIIDEPLVLTHHRGATIVGFVHFFTMMLTLTIYREFGPDITKLQARGVRPGGIALGKRFFG